MNDKEYQRVFNHAIRLLARAARSEADLRSRLIAKTAAELAVIERVLGRLKELGYINDDQFAYNYANNKLAVKPLGRVRLQRTLTHKQIAPDVRDRTLSKIFTEQDEAQLCAAALAKHVRIHGLPQDIKESKKLLSYLIRLGFPYDLVMKKIRQLSKEPLLDD